MCNNIFDQNNNTMNFSHSFLGVYVSVYVNVYIYIILNHSQDSLKWRVKRSWTWSRLGWPTNNLEHPVEENHCTLHYLLALSTWPALGYCLLIELVMLLLATIASSCWSYRLNPRRLKFEYTKVLQSAILLLELHISLASPRFSRETSISTHMCFIFLVG